MSNAAAMTKLPRIATTSHEVPSARRRREAGSPSPSKLLLLLPLLRRFCLLLRLSTIFSPDLNFHCLLLFLLLFPAAE
jgi:hypothetical protein